MKLLAGIAFVLILGGCVSARAQGVVTLGGAKALAGLTGTVTGRVFAEDSRAAIRLARATLVPILDTTPSESRTRPSNQIVRSAQSSADGVFTIGAIPPGDYYLAASATGYISTWDELQWKLRTGLAVNDLVNRLARVHVSAGVDTTANLTLTHGGVIAGRVEWEDGTPAATLQILCQPRAGSIPLPSDVMAIAQTGKGNDGVRTNDRGEFRAVGLAPNEYTLMVLVSQQNFSTTGRPNFISLQIFAPGVFRKTEAQHVKIGSAEERNDVHIVLNLSRTHTIAGRVVSSVPNHVLSSGRVSLIEVRQAPGSGEPYTGSDATISRDTNFDAQGSYTIPYVPPGNYAVQVSPQWDEGHNGEFSRETIKAKSSLENLTVGDTDLSMVDINLTSATK